MRLPESLPLRATLFVRALRSVRGVYKLGGLMFLIATALFYAVAFQAPNDFPRGVIVEIEKGASAGEVAQVLAENNIVVSSFWFTSIVVLFVGEERVIAGSYFFAEPRSAFQVAWRLARGKYELDPVRVLVVEGATVADIANVLEKRLYKFDAAVFRALTEGKEGYLFPDTYYISPVAKPEEVLTLMTDTFVRRIEPLRGAIELFGKPLHDVITMASLLEKEARTRETRRTIAGVLWKRISIGMPLQVDATFLYINGRNSFTLTSDDLAIDSPYNTYRYKGLPVGPIANPGLASIEAAITPIATPYLYYLADKRGVTHYSRTFAEHVAKKRVYLR